MIAHIYRYRNQFIVPTVTRTPDGIYIEAEPVDVIASEDAKGLESAIKRVLSAGNRQIPAVSVTIFPKPVVLRYAKVRSWGEFERKAFLWQIESDGSDIALIPTQQEPDGGWSELKPNAEIFAGDSAVSRIVTRIRDA